MVEDDKKIAESIRNGTYYAQARDWFETMYIGPVSERSFFLIIAVLSGFIALFSVSSVMRLMPLDKREPILIRAPENYDDIEMTLVKIGEPREAVNPALSYFYVTQYVIARESFYASTFTANAKFVRAQSDSASYTAYAQSYDPANPASPFAALGDGGQRQVNIDNVRMHAPEKGSNQYTAEVNFTVDTVVNQQETKSRWTAQMNYIYTQITPELVTDPETKQKVLSVNDPQFQVVNYVLAQRQ